MPAIRRKVTLVALVVAALFSVLASGPGVPGATAKTVFHPRAGRAMGLAPARGADIDIAQGPNYEAVYHGGPVMSGTVTVHTIFWAPSGYHFDGSPGAGILGYEPMIQQFFTDAAHDSGTTGNVFSVLDQYGDNQAQGRYSLAYAPATDSIADTDPYPHASSQCPSPSGTGTCVTDVELAQEVDRVIGRDDPRGRGLHDVWEVFLPPNVDECTGLGVCGTNAFAGYHSEADEGHGAFIYAVMIDTLIEQTPIPGADPEGNPEAEATIDTAAHETVEAITNPEGAGWMDPNGYEVADKCEDGFQQGQPLGYAANGSPYNQIVNGHEYDIQEMWSNATSGCVQSSSVTRDSLPLPSISMHQFSPAVSGNTGVARGGVPVRITLIRGLGTVAVATARTRRNGGWGPVSLTGPHGAPHGLGDDRDAVFVEYGAGGPAPDLIATGSGGDPFSEAGWTGWLDLDTGFLLGSRSVSLSPCGQTGVITVRVNGRRTASPLPECQTETSVATVPAGTRLTGASRVTVTSQDNRAVSPFSLPGALVSLTVTAGEPGSVGALPTSNEDLLPNNGLPACTAELRLQLLSCDGLVPGARYTLTRSRGGVVRTGRAGSTGAVRFSGFPGAPGSRGFLGRAGVAGGDRFALRNTSRRVLTVLHVAHLRVAITGNETVVSGGTCQPGDYYGAPLTRLPYSSAIGVGGAAGLGRACPASGRARGLPDHVVAQTDDLSGGLTRTSVPYLAGEAPANDAIVYGRFRALAQTSEVGASKRVFSTGARVGLTITAVGARRSAFHASDVAGSSGVAVNGLGVGVYVARWVISDLNGDTRTVVTHFQVAG